MISGHILKREGKNTLNKKVAIAIDGPAAAGKSTVAKIVAKKLSYIYIDTGAMYRALTLAALEKSIDVNHEDQLVDLLDKVEIELIQNDEGQNVMMNQKDVTLDIRTQHVSNQVSYIAKHPRIRKEMVKRQQNLAGKRDVVMDGRDIGTHVLPHAEVKVFLIATVEERAKRRYEENIEKGFPTDIEELKREIQQRDEIDSKRDVAPLIKADDAIEIDTTSLSIEEVAGIILEKVTKTKN